MTRSMWRNKLHIPGKPITRNPNGMASWLRYRGLTLAQRPGLRSKPIRSSEMAASATINMITIHLHLPLIA
jgi:hypothetical protein